MQKEIEIIKDEGDISEKERLHIQYPFYKNNYIEIVKIFLQNNIKRKKYYENAKNSEREIEKYQKYMDDMTNVMTIIGKRGSGKTTVMREVRSIFQNFNDNKSEWIKRIGEPYASEVRDQIYDQFIIETMEVIDAGVLEEKDDLIEIILWNILNKVKGKIDSQGNISKCNINNRELQKFVASVDEVYHMHQSVQERTQGSGGESVITLLNNMPNSIRTRQAMRSLLDAFFEIMCPGKKESAFLVISIDDLDLNIHKGYQMLEEIRRYLLDWRIIVLLTVEYNQMEKICEVQFRKEFAVKSCDVNDDDLEKQISELCNSYMIKVFPFLNRICIPERVLKSAFIRDDDKYGVKEYLLIKIVEKMLIYYDAHGLKTHFCEPDTVRELVSYIQFLDSLNTISLNDLQNTNDKEAVKRQLMYYNQNHERFNQDIIERMVFQKLQSQQRITFQDLLKRDLERRAGYVLQCYDNITKKKKLMEAVTEREHYNFSDFLECIYKWGRDTYDYKPLTHCILASFTSEMTREYINYRYNIDDETSRERSRKRLKGYLGDNISGTWLAEGMGRMTWNVIQTEESDSEESKSTQKTIEENAEDTMTKEGTAEKDNQGKDGVYIGYLEKRSAKAFGFLFPVDWNKEIEDSKIIFAQIVNHCIENNILPIWECLLLCMKNFPNSKDEGKSIPKIKMRITRGYKAGVCIKMDVISAPHVDIDILGFISHSLDYSLWKKELETSMVEQLIECVKAISGCKENTESEFILKYKRLLEETAIFFGQGENFEMAFPLYDLDLAYNVLKRVRRKGQAEASVINIKYVVERIKLIYTYIEEELREEEKKYCKLDNIGGKFNYTAIFRNDPYIKKFYKLIENENSKKCLIDQISGMYTGAGIPWLSSREKAGESLEND